MEFKEYKTMTNAELKLYKIELNDEYEATKAKINNLCKYIESLGREYERVERENNTRNVIE